MKQHRFKQRIFSILTALLFFACLFGSFPAAVKAENFQFITDIKLAAGDGAFDALEYEGYHVMMVGLNAGVPDASQVYLGYKLNTGSPVTNIIVAKNEGESFELNGAQYYRAGEADVDYGVSYEGAGYLYITWDAVAGDPLVGLDVVRTNYAEDETPVYTIPNDGAEFVRDQYGYPVDLEQANPNIGIFLAQIRNGLVKPYISELALFYGTDKSDAVYKAAAGGFNYYLDGDIDDSSEMYTLIAYHRTADPNAAITNITAISADMAQKLEDGQIIAGAGEKALKAPEAGTEAPLQTEAETEIAEEPAAPAEEAVTIEEAANEEIATEAAPAEEAVTTEEVASEAAPAEEASTEAAPAEEAPTEAAPTEEALTEAAPTEAVPAETEPIAEEPGTEETVEELTEPVILMTAAAVEISGCEYVRISSYQVAGAVPYYLYASKDPKAGNPITMLYVEDNTAITETFLGTWGDGYFSSRGMTKAQSFIVNEDKLEELKASMDVYIHAPIYLLSPSASEDAFSVLATDQQMLKISMLTAKEGLPEGRYELTGMRAPSYEPPYLNREGQPLPVESDQPASAFTKAGLPVIIIGGVVVLAGIVFLIVKMKRKQKEG